MLELGLHASDSLIKSGRRNAMMMMMVIYGVKSVRDVSG